MKKRILLIAMVGINLTIYSQTKIGFNTFDDFDVAGNSVAHYGISSIRGTGYFKVGVSGYFGLNFYTKGLERIKIHENGNVGIGIATPSVKLDVGGDVLLNSFSRGNEKGIFFRRNFVNSNKYNLSILTYNHTGGSSDGLSLNAYDGISFSTGSNSRNERMRISQNGNIGIGTSNPDMKLTVKGNIHAEEIKVDLNIPAPDYVFKSDYKLRSIREVEDFIKVHSHLPEIPSAEEFAKNGVLQAEMDMSLLKKIEELTLYTIEQEKKLISQKNEIEELKKQDLKIEKQQKEIEALKILVHKLLKNKN